MDDPDSMVEAAKYFESKEQSEAYAGIVDEWATNILPLWDGTNLVEHSKVEDKLWNATVRVHFRSVTNFFKESGSHSIKAEIVDMSILKESPQANPFNTSKRILDGPLTPEKEGALGKRRKID